MRQLSALLLGVTIVASANGPAYSQAASSQTSCGTVSLQPGHTTYPFCLHAGLNNVDGTLHRRAPRPRCRKHYVMRAAVYAVLWPLCNIPLLSDRGRLQ